MSVIGEDALKEKARQWAAQVVELYNTPVPPELEADKARLLKYAKTVKNAIEKVFPNFSDIADTGQALGFVQYLIPAALIMSAAAAVTYWVLEYKKFKARLAEFKRLEPIVGADNAAKVLDTVTGSKPVFSLGTGSLLPLAVIGGAAYLMLR